MTRLPGLTYLVLASLFVTGRDRRAPNLSDIPVELSIPPTNTRWMNSVNLGRRHLRSRYGKEMF